MSNHYKLDSGVKHNKGDAGARPTRTAVKPNIPGTDNHVKSLQIR